MGSIACHLSNIKQHQIIQNEPSKDKSNMNDNNNNNLIINDYYQNISSQSTSISTTTTNTTTNTNSSQQTMTDIIDTSESTTSSQEILKGKENVIPIQSERRGTKRRHSDMERELDDEHN